jgi:hypothetical protein
VIVANLALAPDGFVVEGVGKIVLNFLAADPLAEQDVVSNLG